MRCYRLPEIPLDTSEDNPIMRVHDYPEFSHIDSSRTVTGCAKLSIEYDVELGKHIENLKGMPHPYIVQLVLLKVSMITLKVY